LLSAAQAAADEERRRRQREKKQIQRKKQESEKETARQNAGDNLNALAAVCSAVSTTAQSAINAMGSLANSAVAYCSPEKTPNWSAADDVRMILAACTPELEHFLERLGATSERVEAEVSNSHQHVLPDDQFFSALMKMFNNPDFIPVIPWPADKRCEPRGYALKKRRDEEALRKHWFAVLSLYEGAIGRYNRSGQTGTECFCMCGAPGFYTTSGFKKGKEHLEPAAPYHHNPPWHHDANKVSRTARVCVWP
jgi:hypothetical protein